MVRCLYILIALLLSAFSYAEPAKTLVLPTAIKSVYGDFDTMQQRRIIRVLIPYSKTFYFLDNQGTPRGLMVELMQEFDKQLNNSVKPDKKIHVVLIPTSRDKLIPDLLAGKGDVIAANLTMTPERQQLVDFSTPLATGVHEVVVANKLQPPLTTINDLAGKSVFINPSTSYMQSVSTFNKQLKKQGLAPLHVNSAPGNFEPEDILEMVNANLAGYTVVDRYLTLLWQKIYPNLVVYDHIALREDGNIALAWRKNSPLLRAKLDPFCASHKLGSSFGNQQVYKYLRSVKWVKSATSEKELTKFAQVTAIFQKYGKQYSVDWLLMVAQGYQESQLDQTKRSHSGAIGIMQLLPSTGKSLKVGDITQADPNINAGVKYIRFMQERYFADQPMDDLNKMLFTFAAYNAGPAKVEKLRKQAKAMGLDPNRWFDNVERVAQLKIGNETVQYVSNIFKYYIAYALITQEQREKEQAAKPAPH